MKETRYNALNKTFARRVGKALTKINKIALEEILPHYLYSSAKLQNSNHKKHYLEIGFGMGEHFLHQINSNIDSMYIGAEVYLNGVANVIKRAANSDQNSANYMIWPDDVDLLLADMPSACLDGIYVLFPDPWHKRRYLKKRLLNKTRLGQIKDKLQSGGFLSFASDIEDYFASVHSLLQADNDFILSTTDYLVPYVGYIETKYHQKAVKENRTPKFLTATLRLANVD